MNCNKQSCRNQREYYLKQKDDRETKSTPTSTKRLGRFMEETRLHSLGAAKRILEAEKGTNTNEKKSPTGEDQIEVETSTLLSVYLHI